jgi:hypothetical protein
MARYLWKAVISLHDRSLTRILRKSIVLWRHVGLLSICILVFALRGRRIVLLVESLTGQGLRRSKLRNIAVIRSPCRLVGTLILWISLRIWICSVLALTI